MLKYAQTLTTTNPRLLRPRRRWPLTREATAMLIALGIFLLGFIVAEVW